MSKSRYSPIRFSSVWVRKLSHRKMRRIEKRYLYHLKQESPASDDASPPCEKKRRKLFLDWYW